MSRRSVVLCGVPTEYCTGSKYTTDQNLPSKAHGDSEEAFRCMRHYLISQGYEPVGSRDFRPLDGGPIRILTKKSHYGSRLRLGKLGERFMPESRDQGNRGVIIKT
jgi:hypothetical protein